MNAAEFAERNTVDEDGDMYDAHGNPIPSEAAEEILFWRMREAQPVSAGAEPLQLERIEHDLARKLGYATEKDDIEYVGNMVIQLRRSELWKPLVEAVAAAQSLPAQTVNQEMLKEIISEMRGEVRSKTMPIVHDAATAHWADRLESAIARAESELKKEADHGTNS